MGKLPRVTHLRNHMVVVFEVCICGETEKTKFQKRRMNFTYNVERQLKFVKHTHCSALNAVWRTTDHGLNRKLLKHCTRSGAELLDLRKIRVR